MMDFDKPKSLQIKCEPVDKGDCSSEDSESVRHNLNSLSYEINEELKDEPPDDPDANEETDWPSLELCSSHIQTYFEDGQKRSDSRGGGANTMEKEMCHYKGLSKIDSLLPPSIKAKKVSDKMHLLDSHIDKDFREEKMGMTKSSVEKTSNNNVENDCDEQYQCTFCYKLFPCNPTGKSYLLEHKKTHAHEKLYKCDLCWRIFSQKSNLTKHLPLHNDDRPHKCEVCDKRFAYKSSIIQHMRIHTDEKPFECNLCFRRFRQNSNLAEHKRSHSEERPYKCEICSKSFAYKSSLTQHRRTHTNEKPFKCDVCNKRFGKKYTFIVHKRIHTQEQPYRCKVCDKGFIHSTAYNRHKKIHPEEKLFHCDLSDISRYLTPIDP